MKHDSGGWEPEWDGWLRTFREIEASITRQVDRYVRLRRWDMLRWFLGGMFGVWVGVGSAELVKWWVGLH